MLSFDILSQVVEDQMKIFLKKDVGIIRHINFNKYLKTKQIVVVSGIRRSGKSTLLCQFSKRHKNFYYINFDDERLIDFDVNDFNNLMIVFKKMYQSNTIFIDEAQNVQGFERFVRRLYEENFKIYLTGSNAKLLSSELATHLTGRYVKIELLPFSFQEFLDFKKIDFTKNDTDTKGMILKNFEKYLLNGGLPEFLKYKDDEFLKRMYEDILYKDLLVRYAIREVKAFKELISYVFTNFASEISYNGLKNILAFKSPVSVKDYLDFVEGSYLISQLYKYDFSLKQQFIGAKKIYVIDNGLRNKIFFSFSDDKGKNLENLVFVELKRRGYDLFYFKDKNECDFVCLMKNKIFYVIQVCYDLNNTNFSREINGLLNAMDKLKCRKGLIITFNNNYSQKITNKNIEIKNVINWLLNK